MSDLSDEQRIALAHLRRVCHNLEDIPVTDRVALSVSSIALLIEAVMTENAMAVQERARVTLALLDPSR